MQCDVLQCDAHRWSEGLAWKTDRMYERVTRGLSYPDTRERCNGRIEDYNEAVNAFLLEHEFEALRRALRREPWSGGGEDSRRGRGG